jgi:phage terminase large subunit-like protein
VRPAPARDAWVAPRGAAKTSWLYLALPLWALAHGHRRFFLAFSYTAQQAAGHLANLRRELAENELLLYDFPELAPRKGPGLRNTTTMVVGNGATIAAHGLGSTVLGIRSGTDRPDLLVGDDCEPTSGDYSPKERDKLLAKLVEGVLPMGSRNSVVQLTGTVTKAGSIMHDVVRAELGEARAPWLVDKEFATHYYPPVLDEGGPGERSLWPQRWELTPTHFGEWKRGTKDFALNMENNPAKASSMTYWTREGYTYDQRMPVHRRVISIDGAVTRNASSDYTALAVLATDVKDGLARRVSVELAEQRKITGRQVLDRIYELHEKYPRSLTTVLVETNQGGDMWGEILRPLPVGVRLVPYRVHGSKRGRIEVLHKHYEDGRVSHLRRLAALESQQCDFPNVANDDLLDAVAGGVRYLLTGRAEA